MLEVLALLAVALLFTALPGRVAGAALRRAFPHFYLFVLVTTAPARQLLMPAINTATDTGATTRFKVLHSVSVLISVAHIVVAGYVLVRFI